MILPLVMEQFLLMLMLVGLSDTFIVSQCMARAISNRQNSTLNG